MSQVESEFITVDDGEFSDLGESVDTDITSLSSSIRNHIYENGRRYHSLNAGAYVIPNDELEQERLDMFRHTVSLCLGGALHVVELPKKLDRILDCGTGTGLWAIDMADTHPEAQVIGVDLSPIQPAWVPPNCSFEVDDLEKEWTWKQPFDFIHSSNVSQGIRDWPAYTKQMFEHLTPGGVVQVHESEMEWFTDDDSVPKGGSLESYMKNLRKCLTLAGLEVHTDKLEGYLKDAGFVDVKVVHKKIPFGPWAKDKGKKIMGTWCLAVMEQALKAYALSLFTSLLGMSNDEVEKLCNGAFAEFRRRDVHAYGRQWFVEGRKPTEDEVAA